jgi:hypothetical protein
LLQKNIAIIFPEPRLEAWDNLPRFTFLDADLSKMKKKQTFTSRIRHIVKPNFIGSPIRLIKEGGLLESRPKLKVEKKNDSHYNRDSPEVVIP